MLIDKLNALYAQHQDPDRIVAGLTDPLARFLKIKDLDADFAREHRDRRICYFRWGGSYPCWDCEKTAETALGFLVESSAPNWRFLRDQWAIIGYEHRFNEDPFEVFK